MRESWGGKMRQGHALIAAERWRRWTSSGGGSSAFFPSDLLSRGNMSALNAQGGSSYLLS
ncbi:hypothetical protein ACS0TY_016501 [Phlomoides rotata]